MSWPLSQDYNEAVQNPAHCFADSDLHAGQPVTNALGLPMPRSGNFADVYEIRSPGGRWAVKCFTRQVPSLRERYAAISTHLRQFRPRFAVDFQFLEQGILVRGQWFPALKMQWVEGLLLNDFVRDVLDRPARLGALAEVWLRLARRLREAGLAHGDLQHGNVLLVPDPDAASLHLRLIDYDGLWVPALAAVPSGEAGHPAYQHPRRLREGTYNAEVDRFPLLVVFVAIRALMAGGRALWDKYDNGDNLLFREQDLRSPRDSALFRELVRLNDPDVPRLADQLSRAVYKPLEETPLLENLPSGAALGVPAVQERRGVAVAGAPPVRQAAPDAPLLEPTSAREEDVPRWPFGQPRMSRAAPWLAGIAAGAFFLLCGLVLWAVSGSGAVDMQTARLARSSTVRANGNPGTPERSSPPQSPAQELTPEVEPEPVPPSSPTPKPESKPEPPRQQTPETKSVVEQPVVPKDDAGRHGEPEFENSIHMQLRLIPGGRFQMGSPPEETDRVGNEDPRHTVEISRPFYLGVYPVTQEGYEQVTGANPSYFSPGGAGKEKVAGLNTRRFPVEQVSWHDAVAFCEKLSGMEREKKAGRTYRLPTEAEWEYACRGGTTTRFSFGERISAKDANFDGTKPYGGANKEVSYGGGEKGPSLGRTTAVGSYPKNTFGLYDMHGNVYQWCNDWHDEDYFKNSPEKDPPGPASGPYGERSVRGGAWADPAWNCRAAARSRGLPDSRVAGIGFRVVCVVPGTP